MRLHKLLFAASLLLLSALPAAAKDPPRSFSLSTSRTFAPGESVKIQLMARNVPELEFRVYKVRDAQKFFAGLKDLHSFGQQSYAPAEQVDQETWIERIHDFKAHVWWLVRHFFRGRFTDDARDTFREEQGKLGRRSRVVGAAQFAQIPILNPSQLVARWRLVTPPVIVSETQQLPIDGLGAGVYLIEATDGTYKAYTVAIVTSMAVVERTQNGQAFLYVADRKSGAPVAKANVACGPTGSSNRPGRRTANGMATLGMSDSLVQLGGTPDNVWVVARRGADAALVTPWGYGLARRISSRSGRIIYTDRPVYRPGHTVHIKAVVRASKRAMRCSCRRATPTLEVTDSANKVVFSKAIPLSAHGSWPPTSFSMRMLRWATTTSAQAREGSRQRQLLRGGLQEAGVPGHGEAGRRSCCRATRFRPASRRAISLASRWREQRSLTWCTLPLTTGGMRATKTIRAEMRGKAPAIPAIPTTPGARLSSRSTPACWTRMAG